MASPMCSQAQQRQPKTGLFVASKRLLSARPGQHVMSVYTSFRRHWSSIQRKISAGRDYTLLRRIPLCSSSLFSIFFFFMAFYYFSFLSLILLFPLITVFLLSFSYSLLFFSIFLFLFLILTVFFFFSLIIFFLSFCPCVFFLLIVFISFLILFSFIVVFVCFYFLLICFVLSAPCKLWLWLSLSAS